MCCVMKMRCLYMNGGVMGKSAVSGGDSRVVNIRGYGGR